MLVFHTPVLPEDMPIPYSYRSRAIIPSENIEDSRVTDDIKTINQDDVVVLGKKHKLEDAMYLSSKNIKFIIDVADYKFGLFKHWNQTIPMAHGVTSTCEFLAEQTEKLTGVDNVLVIPDPTEREQKEIHTNFDKKIKLLYYGADSNFAKIDWFTIEDSLKKVTNIDLKFMTNKGKNPPNEFESKKALLHHNWCYYEDLKDINARGKKTWHSIENGSFDKQQHVLNWCDIVILPVTNDLESKCKGNNRPIDALQSGKFVITNPGIPSYEKLNECIWIGNLSKGLKYSIDNIDTVKDKINAGQKMIDKDYLPSKVALKWKGLYENISRNNF